MMSLPSGLPLELSSTTHICPGTLCLALLASKVLGYGARNLSVMDEGTIGYSLHVVINLPIYKVDW